MKAMSQQEQTAAVLRARARRDPRFYRVLEQLERDERLGISGPRMFDAHVNLGYSTISTAPSPATTGTTIACTGGNPFPTPPYNAIIGVAGWSEAQWAAGGEIVRVSANTSSKPSTIVRASEGPNAARTVVVGDVIKQVYSSANYTAIENPVLAVVKGTTRVNIASTTEAAGTSVLSSGSVAFDGSEVFIEFFCARALTPSVTGGIFVCLFEGATELARLCYFNNGSAVQIQAPLHLFFDLTPSAGSHTYTLTAFADSTTGTPFLEAGSGGTGTFAPMVMTIRQR